MIIIVDPFEIERIVLVNNTGDNMNYSVRGLLACQIRLSLGSEVLARLPGLAFVERDCGKYAVRIERDQQDWAFLQPQ